jgi:tetratricopeptide (TPR) repeat protein
MKAAALLATALAITCGAHAAQANVWDRAIDSDKPQRAADDKYESEMRQGDEYAIRAAVRNASLREVKQQLGNAISSYRAAAAAKPREGEPYFRIGKLLYAFYFDCPDGQSRRGLPGATLTCLSGMFDPAKAKEVIAAWDAFELRAPDDPRLSVDPVVGESEILFDRAILHTRLATKADLTAAAADYEKLLSRYDAQDGSTSRVLGNLAETYMMIGRMEESLETYREALRGSSDTSTWYGYAVALDRDESTRQALEIIRSLGREELEHFVMQVAGGTTFFVPEGEKYYYFALAKEAFGLDEEAIEYWQEYIKSGAHPEFQPRAKAHLDALAVRKKRKAIPIDSPWPPELFR